MKGLNFLEKILFFVNSIAILILLATYATPFLDPSKYSTVALLSIVYPFIFIINVIFVIVWLIKLKPHFLLSTIILLLGYNHIETFISFNKKETKQNNQETLDLISYNVRQFNRFQWIKSNSLEKDISNFLNQEKPNIVCFQEYIPNKKIHLNLPHKFIHRTKASGLAIYSKYPILNTGFINFKNSANNFIYVDLEIKNQKIRIYNVHLESFGVDVKKDYNNKSKLTSLYQKMKKVFTLQSTQIKKLNEHIQQSPYKAIVTGDFNSTAFSWNYKQITENFKDAFVEKGNGIGKSFNFVFPFRIDYIFTNKSMEISNYKTFKIKLSDHYPIMAKIITNN